MTRRISIILAFLAFLNTAAIAQSLTYYEYWFDNDLSQRTTVPSAASELSLGIDISGLSDGLHLLSLRGQDDNGVWGAAKTKMFYILFKGDVHKAVEYWMDNDLDNRTELASVGDSLCIDIDVESLHEGLHTLSLRGKNEYGVWGAAKTKMFYISRGDICFRLCEYWFDEKYEQHRTQNLSGVSGEIAMDIDISKLTDGLHFFNIRVQNINGMWSNANRQMFYIPDMGEFVRWECWIDDNFEGRKCGELDDSELAIPIEVGELEDGLHTVYFRAQDTAGKWSSQKSAEFELLPLAGIEAVASDADSAPMKMYDLQGRRINEAPKHGIYIVGNRKVLVRP